MDSLRGTREAGKDSLDSLRGTREAGKDQLDSLRSTREAPGRQERTICTAWEAPVQLQWRTARFAANPGVGPTAGLRLAARSTDWPLIGRSEHP